MNDTFPCTLITPEALVFDGPALYASIPAWDGQIGIASMRAPLLAKLGDGALRIDRKGAEPLWYFLSGGFAQMKDNHLTLLTSAAVPVEEIDRPRVEAEIAAARTTPAVTELQVKNRQRQLDRGRAMLALAEKHGVDVK